MRSFVLKEKAGSDDILGNFGFKCVVLLNFYNSCGIDIRLKKQEPAHVKYTRVR